MQVTLHARLPAEDTAQKLLFASASPQSEAAGIFPGGTFRSEAAVKRRVAYLDSRSAGAQAVGSRSGLQELLRLENSFSTLTAEQEANLQAAGSGRALYVLTGQQPGLFGGPLLWLYKALTCAALAKEWSKRLSRPVIPIFWAAGDDADLQECNNVELLDADADGGKVAGPLSLAFPDAARPIAVGERRIDEQELTGLLKRLGGIWNPETIELLRRCYRTGGTLTEGFLRLAQSQLGREGVLFVDGYSRNIRSLGRPILEQAVKGWEAHQALLLAGTEAANAAGIETQVSLRTGVVHAFVLRNGERQRLFAEPPAKIAKTGMAGQPGNTKATGRIYIPENPAHDLLPKLADLELTHDVFTRPLIADAIFPVLGHVLGPAELRYFAQMSRLFPEMTGDMPLMHPRMTASAAPRAAREEFLAEGLEISDLVRMGPSGLRARLEARTWQAHPAASALSREPGDRWLEGLRKVHGSHFKDSGPAERLQKTMASAWKRYLRSLERMAYADASGTKADLFARLKWLGGGMGQDRHLSLPSLLNAVGEDGLAALRASLDPVSPELQLFLFTDGHSVEGEGA